MYGQQQYNVQQVQHGGFQDSGFQDSHIGDRFSCRPIVLDDYNSDLNFVVAADGLTGSSLHQEGFEYLWAGARATHGVSTGKVCFEVVVMEKLAVNMPETERTPHVVRVGWSTDFSTLQVGEDAMSYGYGGTGKFSVNKKFFDYGGPYTINDVIGCYINLDAKSIFFTKNGHYLGEAFRLGLETNDKVFYPHVTVKNMKFRVNFGVQEPYFPLVDGYSMIQYVLPNLLVRAIGSPDTRKDCQVIMMVGIPASGKTCWAAKYAKENKLKKFNIIGTNAIMDRMKVMGLARQRNYHGRWDALIKQATDILNKILKIAENKNRNYILDQTNVYPGARKRKIKNFHGFHRIAAVLAIKDDVLKYRTEKREKEEGKIVPESAVMQMKANFTLPERGDTFDEVWFVEEDEGTSRRLVEKYNKEGKEYTVQEPVRKDPPQTQPQHQNNQMAHLHHSTGLQGTHGYTCSAQNPRVSCGYDSQGYNSNNPGNPFDQASVTHQAMFPMSQSSDPRAHLHHLTNQPEALGYSAHNPRVLHGNDSHGYGSNNPVPFDQPAITSQERFSMPQGHTIAGAVRHNPVRESYSMSVQRGMSESRHNRYMPYGAARRHDTYAEQMYLQNQVSSQYYANINALQYPQSYGGSIAYVDRAGSNVHHYSVPDSRPVGCSSYEPLTSDPYNTIRIPTENEHHDIHH